jgi:hypothetical protein
MTSAPMAERIVAKCLTGFNLKTGRGPVNLVFQAFDAIESNSLNPGTQFDTLRLNYRQCRERPPQCDDAYLVGHWPRSR